MSAKAELQRRKLRVKAYLKALSPAPVVSPPVSSNEMARREKEAKEAEANLLAGEAPVTPSPPGSKKNKGRRKPVVIVTPPPSEEKNKRNAAEESSNVEANEFLLPQRAKDGLAAEEGRARESAERRAERERQAAAERAAAEELSRIYRSFYEEIKTTAERITDERFKLLLTRVNELVFHPDSVNVGFELPLGKSKEQYIDEEKSKLPTFINRLQNMIPTVFDLKSEDTNADKMNQILCDSMNKQKLFITIKNYILPLILLYIHMRRIEVQTLPVVEIREEAVVIDFGKGPEYLHVTIHTDKRLCGKGTIGAFHARAGDRVRRYRIDMKSFGEIFREGPFSEEEVRLINFTMTLIRKLWNFTPGGGYRRTRKIKRTH